MKENWADNVEKEKKIHSVKYNFVMNFILSASQFIFPLITFPYVSRVLLAEGNGKLAFVSSVVNYFLMLASLGIPTYGIRACAQIRDSKEKLSKTAHEILMINCATTVLVIISYLFCIILIPRFQENRVLFLINGVNLLLNVVGMDWLYRALEQYEYITIRSIAAKILGLVLMFIFVHEKDDYIIYGEITVFAAVGFNIFNFVRSRKYIDYKWYGNYEFRKHLKPILILFAQNLAVSIYTNLDTVMLGFMKTDRDVGYYNAAIKVKSILVSLVTSLGNVLLPRMSYLAKEKKHTEYMHTMAMALNATMLMSIPVTIYFCLYASDAILLLAGEGYEGAIKAMQVITLSVVPIGLTGVLGIQVLTSLEKEKYVLYSVVVGALVDFALNMVLIPTSGATGAALATVIAEFAVLVVQVIFTKSYLGEIKNNLRGYWYILLTIPSAIVAILIKNFDLNSFFRLLFSACTFFGIYGLGLLIIREKIVINMLKGILKNKQ